MTAEPRHPSSSPAAPATPGGGEPATTPELSGVVVHWHGEELLAELVRRWPRDPRFELVVVDNGSTGPLPAAGCRLVRPAANLGFAGAANAGVAVARAPLLLLLNPDAHPEPGALEALLDGFAAHPEAAGLAPRLVGEDGRPQHRWQLRRLPGPGQLLLHCLLLPPDLGAATEPPPGAPVEQPAAAALALRRDALLAIDGLDPGFYPAWFEDVDLCRSLADTGRPLLYWPAAVFRHRLGASLPRLGYGPFLWIYYRNLTRYLARHHGGAWPAAARALLAVGMLLRLALLPLRHPRRAASRAEAARALAATALAALTNWRRPHAWAATFAPPPAPDRPRRPTAEPPG